MRQQWEFSGAAEGWYWRATDVVSGAMTRHARRAFASFAECVRDAEEQGYGGSPEDKRVYRIGGALPCTVRTTPRKRSAPQAGAK